MTKPNVRVIKRYNVNLDKDTAIVLSKAFNDVFLGFQKDEIRKKSAIKLSNRNKKHFNLLIEIFENFIKLNYHQDDVKSFEVKSIRKQFDDWEYNIELVKKIWILFNKLDTLELLIYILEFKKKHTIDILRIIAKFWNFIPFETFSIQEILYKKFEKIIDDKNKEIDTYKHINTSIITMVFSAISAIWAIFTIQTLPEQFQSLTYWFIVVLWLVFIYYLFDFISNIFQIRKNKYILDSLYAFTEPFDDPDENINEGYIDYIKVFLWQIRDFKKSDENKVDFENWKKSLKIFMYHRSWDKIKFYYTVIIDILKDRWITLIFVIFYSLYFYISQNNFINLLT